MRNVAMNGAPQIEPPPATPDRLTAHEPRTHLSRQSLCERVGGSHILRSNDMAQIRRRDIFRPRSAFTPPAAIPRRVVLETNTPFHVIGRAKFPSRCRGVRQALERRRSGRSDVAGSLRAAHATALPMGGENLVEFFPVGMGRAEQRAQRWLQR